MFYLPADRRKETFSLETINFATEPLLCMTFLSKSPRKGGKGELSYKNTEMLHGSFKG